MPGYENTISKTFSYHKLLTARNFFISRNNEYGFLLTETIILPFGIQAISSDTSSVGFFYSHNHANVGIDAVCILMCMSC